MSPFKVLSLEVNFEGESDGARRIFPVERILMSTFCILIFESLFDMHMKYADVVNLEKVFACLNRSV
jgi:hypothetical protein